MRTDDGYIIYQCLSGDPDAFGLLVDKYKAGVYALAYSKLRNFHDAQDVSQEVFIRAYKGLHKLRRWESFAWWLYRITSRQCRNWIRAQSKRPDYESIEDRDAGILDDHSMNSYRSELVSQSVHDALDSLPEMHRQVLTLRYLGGMNSFEIARFVGVSPAVVRRRLVNARAALKAEMLDTMSEVFEERRLQAIFTLRIAEMVKHIRVQPLPRLAELGWGLSIALGIMIVVLGSGSFIKLQNYMDSSASEVTGSTGAGEIPVTFIEQISEREGDASMLNSKKMSVAAVFTAMVGILSGNALAQTEWTKYDANPVLSPSDFGVSWLITPGVIYDHDAIEGKWLYKMWVSGTISGEVRSRLYYATSEDGVKWIPHYGHLYNGSVMDAGPAGWDSQYVNSPCVIRDGNMYKMWYAGNPSGPYAAIGYAYSQDGIHWTKYEGNPVFKGDMLISGSGITEVYPGTVILDEDEDGSALYKMWYRAWISDSVHHIGYATSSDGVDWQDEGWVLPDAPDGEWDDLTNNPSVLKHNGAYHMWYSGADHPTPDFTAIGYATSTDGINWERYPDNPVLTEGEYGHWDGRYVHSPAVILQGAIYMMWYPGTSNESSAPKYIGYATAPINQNVDDYVVLAENSALIRQNATVVNGLVGVNDNDMTGPYLTNVELTVGIGALTEVDVELRATNVRLKMNSTVEGDVLYCDELIIGSGAVIGGEQEQSCERFPLFAEMPPYPECYPGTEYVEVPQGGYYELSPGTYGDVMVRMNGTLVLTGGEYDLNSLDTGDNARIYFRAGTTLRIADKFDTDLKVYFGPEPGSEISADEIEVYVCGINGTKGNLGSTPKAAQIGISNTFHGRIYAPNGTLWVRQNTQGVGSFIGKDVIVGLGATVSRQEDAVAAAPPLIPSTAFKGSDPSASWYLGQCYPNPFNPETWIPYKLAEDADVVIKVHTSAGQLIRTLNLGHKLSGLYTARDRAAYWDGRNEAGEQVSSGTYFYTIQAGDFAATKKMVVAR